jgi:hypothetical protein
MKPISAPPAPRRGSCRWRPAGSISCQRRRFATPPAGARPDRTRSEDLRARARRKGAAVASSDPSAFRDYPDRPLGEFGRAPPVALWRPPQNATRGSGVAGCFSPTRNSPSTSARLVINAERRRPRDEAHLRRLMMHCASSAVRRRRARNMCVRHGARLSSCPPPSSLPYDHHTRGVNDDARPRA